MTDQKRPTILMWLGLALLALMLPVGLYFGLYWHMVTAIHYGVAGKSFGVAVYRWNGTEVRQQDFARTLFGPAHWIDRRIRPGSWYGVKPMISD